MSDLKILLPNLEPDLFENIMIGIEIPDEWLKSAQFVETPEDVKVALEYLYSKEPLIDKDQIENGFQSNSEQTSLMWKD